MLLQRKNLELYNKSAPSRIVPTAAVTPTAKGDWQALEDDAIAPREAKQSEPTQTTEEPKRPNAKENNVTCFNSGYRTDNAKAANSARPFCNLVTAAVLLSQSRDLLLLAERATVELEDRFHLKKDHGFARRQAYLGGV
ncbi:hypothetical protein PspLS_10891 [Pyricularia sp. CBS 133598]|nr:hypothetical protein PspLS_10891 [Pyricularia sp. CBS 133598]